MNTTTNCLVRPVFLRVLTLVSVAAVVLTVLGCSGCAGPKVRDDILLPTARSVYPRVRLDIERGIAAAQESTTITAAQADALVADVDRLQAALDEGNRAELALISWAPLEGMAVLGVQDRIAAGELSEANASLFYQRIVNFREALDRLANRVAANIDTRNGARSVTLQTTTGSFRVLSGYIPPDWDDDDPAWSRYYYHNRPRAALGLPLITSGDFPFRPVDVPVNN